MNGMQRDELDDCRLMTCVRFTAGGWENGRLDNFFCMGWEYYVSPTCAAD